MATTRRPPAKEQPPARKKAPAKKAATKKAPATRKAPAKKAATKKAAARPSSTSGVVLLSGGNPQIAKGDGRGPVQAYLDAMPGWKQRVGVELDAIIGRTVPGAHQAVRWNSPFYGADADSWFVSLHCFTRAVRVTFARGARLDPVPPISSKVADVRYLDVGEDDEIDEAQFASWIDQAARLPGETW